MIAFVGIGLVLLVFVCLLVRAERDPETRIAERAVETGDDEELMAYVKLKYSADEQHTPSRGQNTS